MTIIEIRTGPVHPSGISLFHGVVYLDNGIVPAEQRKHSGRASRRAFERDKGSSCRVDEQFLSQTYGVILNLECSSIVSSIGITINFRSVSGPQDNSTESQ